MIKLFHHLIESKANQFPNNFALQQQENCISYAKLQQKVETLSFYLTSIGLQKHDRVGIYLGKNIESVVSFFAVSSSGGIFVPINPFLKQRQVQHILSDCTPKILITSSARLAQLQSSLTSDSSIKHIILIDHEQTQCIVPKIHCYTKIINSLTTLSKKNTAGVINEDNIINERDTASILYTSGSTGQAKGVMLSHKNLIVGAKSVSSYLKNTPSDRILAVLPFSFDYGLSQLSTAFYSGACVVLLEYLLPRDVIKAIEKYQITGLAAVPPLWNKLAKLTWPAKTKKSLRYMTNSGGSLNHKVIQLLRKYLPDTELFLMYGLTEAFRSTYLKPELIDRYPHSIGKAIPNAHLLLVNKKGNLCAPEEIGELVHYGPLVAKGYWNNKKATSKTFCPVNHLLKKPQIPDIAVWSGDLVKQDSEGFIYFVERNDEMIKSSGYRISPTEIEAVFLEHQEIIDAIVFGINDDEIGQSIVLICTVNSNISADIIKKYAKKSLPSFMCPKDVIIKQQFLYTSNGKIDRKSLKKQFQQLESTTIVSETRPTIT